MFEHEVPKVPEVQVLDGNIPTKWNNFSVIIFFLIFQGYEPMSEMSHVYGMPGILL